jgi:hypothetical protein
MTNSALLSARYARVARASVYAHREQDSEFAKMWDEAVEQALDLLHSRVFQRCIEGDLEPIMYMGVPVGWMRKFSDKLQIEMLRAWRPDRFKTPGTSINLATRGDVLVLTEEQRHILMDYKRRELLAAPPPASPPPAQLGDAGRSNSSATTPTTYDENTPATDKNPSP